MLFNSGPQSCSTREIPHPRRDICTVSPALTHQLDGIRESLLKTPDIGSKFLEDMLGELSSLKVHVTMLQKLDPITSNIRHGRGLPVRSLRRNLGWIFKKYDNEDNVAVANKQKLLQGLDCRTLLLCIIAFGNLLLLPAEQFSWILNNAPVYLKEQHIPACWIANDAVRMIVGNLPNMNHMEQFMNGM